MHCTKNEVFHKGFFSVNVTKSAISCGFGHIYRKILNGKLHFLCSDILSNACLCENTGGGNLSYIGDGFADPCALAL